MPLLNETGEYVEYETPIGKVCDTSRYAISCVWALPDGDDKVKLIATDGKIAVVVNTTGHLDRPHIIPGALLDRTARKGKKNKLSYVPALKQWQTNDGRFGVEDDAGQFPDVAAVIPATGNGDWRMISLNPNLLAVARDALGKNESVSLLYQPVGDSGPRTPMAILGPIGVAAMMPASAGTTLDNFRREYAAQAEALAALWKKG